MKAYSPVRLLLLTFVLLCGLSGLASAEVSVDAGKKNFDLASLCYILEDNVTVDFGSRVIRADKARVKLATMEVWAEGNIALKQDDLTFDGDQLYASHQSSEAVVQGNTRFATKGLTITADNASYNWTTKIATFNDNVVLSLQGKTTRLSSLKYHVINNRFIEKDGRAVDEPGPSGVVIEDKK